MSNFKNIDMANIDICDYSFEATQIPDLLTGRGGKYVFSLGITCTEKDNPEPIFIEYDTAEDCIQDGIEALKILLTDGLEDDNLYVNVNDWNEKTQMHETRTLGYDGFDFFSAEEKNEETEK